MSCMVLSLVVVRCSLFVNQIVISPVLARWVVLLLSLSVVIVDILSVALFGNPFRIDLVGLCKFWNFFSIENPGNESVAKGGSKSEDEDVSKHWSKHKPDLSRIVCCSITRTNNLLKLPEICLEFEEHQIKLYFIRKSNK